VSASGWAPCRTVRESTGLYVALLSGAALLWFLAAWSFSRIVEFPGATEGGSNALAEAAARLMILRDDRPFRKFVIARALAMGSGLAAPFYVALARDDLGGAISLLGIFIAVEGLAGLVSSPVWGRWSDRSSRQVFAAACGLAAVLSIAVAVWSWLGMPDAAAIWFYPIAFFGLGIAHAGVRLGRKTYLVDMADGNKRTDYVAVSNTVIGALLLVSGLLGAWRRPSRWKGRFFCSVSPGWPERRSACDGKRFPGDHPGSKQVPPGLIPS
jgi:predicted MFS family arabinose efflux permease